MFENQLEKITNQYSRFRICEKRKHPYEEIIIGKYNPKKSQNVLVKCTNCHVLYERLPTKEEIENY